MYVLLRDHLYPLKLSDYVKPDEELLDIFDLYEDIDLISYMYDYEIGICCLSALRVNLLTWNWDNVSEWSDISLHRLLFQRADIVINKIKLL
jgi:hypothetical protein